MSLQKVLYSNSWLSATLGELLTLLLMLAVNVFLIWALTRLFRRKQQEQNASAKASGIVLGGLQLLLWGGMAFYFMARFWRYFEYRDFWGYRILREGSFTLRMQDVALVSLVLVGTVVIVVGAKRILLQLVATQTVGQENANALLGSIRRLTWLVALMLLLRQIGIMFRVESYFTKNLINTESFKIAPFDIGAGIFVLLATHLLLLLLQKLFNRYASEKKLEVGTQNSIFQIIRYFTWILALTLTLETVGVELTLLLAGSAALLVGIGLGLQQTFNDIFSGFILLFERNLKIKDIVELDGKVGEVQQIGVRTSKIRTRDNIELTLPNSRFVIDPIVNWSNISGNIRIRVNVSVAHGSDVRLVRQLLIECALAHPWVAPDPAPDVFFRNFGASSLDFQLLFWTDHVFFYEKISSDIRFTIEAAFREQGVQIPFQQMDLHLKSGPWNRFPSD